MLRDGAKSRRSRSFVGIAAAAATAVVAIGRSLVGKLRDEIRGARRQITESEYTAGLLRCDQVWSCRKAWPLSPGKLTVDQLGYGWHCCCLPFGSSQYVIKVDDDRFR